MQPYAESRPNLLIVRASDAAGNVTASVLHVTANLPLPAPHSLEVTPAEIEMLVGETQQFTAVDETRHSRTDAVWSLNNTVSGSITPGSSPVFTAVATGSVRLTASVGSISTQVNVNIVPGTALPVGDTRCSAHASPGFTISGLSLAPHADGFPDFFIIETDGAGNDIDVQAYAAGTRSNSCTKMLDVSN